ncbi:MAG: hypothetical protein U9R39_10430 [Campylobacterota bacterium]|nr:hypothetical protein [Campylobacterota bacterium]
MINKVFLSLLIITANILANPQNDKFGSKIFVKCDENKDGFLNQEEYLTMSSKRFNRMDLDKDRDVEIIEIQNTRLFKVMPHIASSWFIKNDLDRNKIVTSQEMEIISNNKFQFMDKNNDKKLSSYEWQTNNPSFNK